MSIDSLERGSAFIELLSELTAAQSREQWISFSQSSMVKGLQIGPRALILLADGSP